MSCDEPAQNKNRNLKIPFPVYTITNYQNWKQRKTYGPKWSKI